MIVEILKGIIDQYHDEQKCGKSWKFVHARKDYSNLYEASNREKCYNHFILERFSVDTTFEIDNNLGLSEVGWQDLRFEAFVGTQGDFDRSYDSESGDNDEGKYDLYIKPIADCIGTGFQTALCEHGAITKWSYVPKINYKDHSFDVIMLKATI